LIYLHGRVYRLVIARSEATTRSSFFWPRPGLFPPGRSARGSLAMTLSPVILPRPKQQHHRRRHQRPDGDPPGEIDRRQPTPALMLERRAVRMRGQPRDQVGNGGMQQTPDVVVQPA